MQIGTDGRRYMSDRDLREMKERVLAHDFTPLGTQEPPKPPVPPPTAGDAPGDLPPINIGGNMGYGNYDNERAYRAIINIIGTILIILLVVGLITAMMFGFPKYNVWRSELEGKAEFVRAEQNRMILIEEAKANLEAEKLNAQAEIERAKGAAAAIEIEGGKLTDAYLRYLWIRQLKTDKATLIYVPTEAGLPVLEAGKAPRLP